MNKFLLTAVICTILICFMAFMAGDPPFNNRGFNNEVQHLEKQEGGWYSK